MRVISSFWTLFGSLGAVGSLLGDFLEPFGNLGGDFEKTFQKVPKQELKNGVPHPPYLRLLRKIGFDCFYKKMLKLELRITFGNVPQV